MKAMVMKSAHDRVFSTALCGCGSAGPVRWSGRACSLRARSVNVKFRRFSRDHAQGVVQLSGSRTASMIER